MFFGKRFYKHRDLFEEPARQQQLLDTLKKLTANINEPNVLLLDSTQPTSVVNLYDRRVMPIYAGTRKWTIGEAFTVDAAGRFGITSEAGVFRVSGESAYTFVDRRLATAPEIMAYVSKNGEPIPDTYSTYGVIGYDGKITISAVVEAVRGDKFDIMLTADRAVFDFYDEEDFRGALDMRIRSGTYVMELLSDSTFPPEPLSFQTPWLGRPEEETRISRRSLLPARSGLRE